MPLLNPIYPFDWDGVDDFHYSRDEKGLPLVYINKRWGLQYNPITIAQFGLHHLRLHFKKKDAVALETAKTAANWLRENARPWHHDALVWLFQYDLDFYGPRAPWISAMAQGEAISLLLRIHEITGDDRILPIVEKAVIPFLREVKDGGVLSHFPDGSPIFEEFPTDPPSQVLNGHIFSLIGLFDYLKFFPDERIQDLWSQAINGLKRNLHRYDLGHWTLYDLHPTHRLASPMYLLVHVRLLMILSDMTGSAFFAEKADKWRNYLSSSWCRTRWFIGKVLEKVRLRGYSQALL
ncbi:MAG: D-glucuronyl C5-epimerase family protein [candidate division KSB1 bacterium]|nr:D-glucuronyl C5-epimerase family protein [candidate division KSB1 bacterium]MDQ7062809.1 D-glucuronyl C5-epimerase family protein [candidate division KSB1 bacterium]